MTNPLLNPFELFAIDIHGEINLKSVKKIYHTMALLTHPDKGGNKEDFITIHQAYNYVLEQLKHTKEMVDMETLEEDFKEFCIKNPVEKLPSLLDLRDDTAIFNKKFNEEWEKKQIDNNVFNLFRDNGYGDLMEPSDIIIEEEKDDSHMELKNKFTTDIIKYEEPEQLPMDGYGNFQRYDIKKVNNYGNIEYKIYDYKETHSEKNPKPIFEEKLTDNPIDNMDKKLKELMKERESLHIPMKKVDLQLSNNNN